jgi:hypothetical protein
VGHRCNDVVREHGQVAMAGWRGTRVVKPPDVEL